MSLGCMGTEELTSGAELEPKKERISLLIVLLIGERVGLLILKQCVSVAFYSHAPLMHASSKYRLKSASIDDYKSNMFQI